MASKRTNWKEKRKTSYQKGKLPYSFTYKMRLGFYGEKCPVCGYKMENGYVKRIPTVQHCIPISLGGKHEINNIAVICHNCNVKLGNKVTSKLNNNLVIVFWNEIKEIKRIGLTDLKDNFNKMKSEVINR